MFPILDAQFGGKMRIPYPLLFERESAALSSIALATSEHSRLSSLTTYQPAFPCDMCQQAFSCEVIPCPQYSAGHCCRTSRASSLCMIVLPSTLNSMFPKSLGRCS